MTNQEAFTTMVLHLRKQGRRSETVDGDRCLYRGPGGMKCAVGALIPEEEYDEEWDRRGILAQDLSCHALVGVDKLLLRKMQHAHDFVAIEAWEGRFARIAEQYSLTLPPLEATHA